MANDKRICKCCGAEYQYCPKCKKYASLPNWMWKCDTEECNELFDVISGYKMGIKTEEDVKDIIEIFSIVDFSKYADGIANTLYELFGNDNKKSKKNKKKEMDIDLKKEATIDEEITKDETNKVEEVIEVTDVTEDIEVDIINTTEAVETIVVDSNLNGISELI